jgi:hypothetical protein
MIEVSAESIWIVRIAAMRSGAASTNANSCLAPWQRALQLA